MKIPQVPLSSLSFSFSLPSCFGCLTSANKAFTFGREPSSASSCHLSARFRVGAIPFLVPLLPQRLDVTTTTTVTFTFTDGTRKPRGSLTRRPGPARPTAVGARGLTATSSPATAASPTAPAPEHGLGGCQSTRTPAAPPGQHPTTQNGKTRLWQAQTPRSNPATA